MAPKSSGNRSSAKKIPLKTKPINMISTKKFSEGSPETINFSKERDVNKSGTERNLSTWP